MEHPAPKSEVVTETQDLPLEKASPDSSATDSPEHQPTAASPESTPDANIKGKTTAAISKRQAKITKQKLAQLHLLHKHTLTKEMLE